MSALLDYAFHTVYSMHYRHCDYRNHHVIIHFVELVCVGLCCRIKLNDCAGVQLLATASRDRLVHIFDIDHDYGLVQTLDDHSSAITAVRFTELDSQLMMLSCGADKSLLFRNAQLVCYLLIVFC